MTTGTQAVSIGNSNQLVFEEKPGGMLWMIVGVGVLVGIGMMIGGMPPKSGKDYGLLTGGLLIAGFSAFLTVSLFKTRNDSSQFFGDRVELYREGKRVQTLAYSNVEHVAYGFRGDGHQSSPFPGLPRSR